MKIVKHIYRFFDQEVEIASDNPRTLDLMDSMYRRFRAKTAENGKQRVSCEILTSNNGKSTIRTNRYNYTVEKTALLPSIAHWIILRETLLRIRSHLLFHAAAFSYNDKGIILVADSGCGKTTLTLALIRQGFRLLSDEITALSLSDGQIAPYHRCMKIRSGTSKVFHHLGWNYPDHSAAIKEGDREGIHLSPQFLGNTCQPNYLIIVKIPPKSNRRPCYVMVDRLENEFVTYLKKGKVPF